MSNLNGIPSADYFETILTNMWNGTTGTVYVSEVPSGTLPNDEYSYIVVNPGEVNMQVGKVDGWDSDNKTFNVVDVAIPSGVDEVYTARNHPVGSKVRFSNNYVFWKEIQEAINSKLDSGTLSPVAISGDYDDLINKPVLSDVALSNDYNDLDNKPTPISIAVGDKVLELSGSNVLSATISASYDNGTKKITLYGANSAVISEIDCTEFIKDGMIQNVQIVTDPVGYAPGKYLEFDFNTDSGVTDIYIALSDLAVYTAGTGIDITSNAITLKKATTSCLGGVIVGSGLSVNDGTISANSQTDENYTTAEKNKLACIESNAQVNVLENVKVNGSNLTVCNKAVDIELKTINGTSITGTGDLDIMARQYTAGTGISISCTDEISISTAYQNTINCKANCSDIPTDNCQLGNGCGYTTCTGTLQACDIADLAQCCDIPSYQSCDFDINGLGDSCCCRDAWNGKQDVLTAGNNISINSNTISGNFNYATSSTAAACTTKCVCIPEITQLCPGQTIIVKPTITATNCATSLKLNDFTAYPIRYNNAALTSTTDGYIRGADCLSTFIFDGSYWHVASKSYDTNTTYVMNYQVDAGKHIAGVGKYAISRYSLVMEKADGTWETLKETSTNYSTATTKTVNTNGFRLNSIRYYNTTTVYANGALIAANTLNNKAASVDMRYSTNCGATTDWAEGDYIYLVGTIGADGLFYLDTTTRWTKTLPTTKDGKVYIRLGIALAAAGYTISLLDDRPIFYYDNGLKIYQQADNKQDVLVSGTNIKTINGCDLLGSGNICISGGGGGTGDMESCIYDPCGCNTDAFDYCNMYNTPTIPTDNCQLANSCGFTTCTGTLSSCADIISALGYTPYSSANPNGYTTCTGTLTSGDLACYACCCDIPTDNCQLGNSCGYITSSYHDSSKQDTLCAGNGIDITSNTVSTASIFGTSSTSAGTATKEVTISSITSLDVGQLIVVKPTITSTTSTTMKLKLNSFDAYNILYDGSSVTTSGTAGTVWRAYVPSIFVLDEASGTKYWRFTGHGVDNNTTYSSMGTSEIDGGTCTCCRVITAANLKYAINHYADLSCYAQCCDIPTVPTDNCQLSNGCGYTTCTGTLTSSDISGLVAESCIACVNGCCLTNGGNVCISGGIDNDTTCTTTTVAHIRAGSEAEFACVCGSPDACTIYYVF